MAEGQNSAWSSSRRAPRLDRSVAGVGVVDPWCLGCEALVTGSGFLLSL